MCLSDDCGIGAWFLLAMLLSIVSLVFQAGAGAAVAAGVGAVTATATGGKVKVRKAVWYGAGIGAAVGLLAAVVIVPLLESHLLEGRFGIEYATPWHFTFLRYGGGDAIFYAAPAVITGLVVARRADRTSQSLVRGVGIGGLAGIVGAAMSFALASVGSSAGLLAPLIVAAAAISAAIVAVRRIRSRRRAGYAGEPADVPHHP